MKFTDLIDLPQLEKSLEVLHRAVGVPVGILDPGGDIIGANGWQDLCMKFHRVNPHTRQRCRESDAYFQARMKEGSLLSFKCRNGLWDTAFPIMIDNAHMVTLSLGQIFFEDDQTDLEFFRKQAAEFGFDVDAYLAAVKRVPILTRQKVGEVMDCAAHFVRHLLLAGMKNHRLEHELGQRRAAEDSLRETRASAEMANLVKGQFISTLSREIRTPMNGVIGVSDLLLDTDLSLEQRDLVETLRAGSDALLVVVDEILDFSTMESGKLELEPIEFNLREVIEDLGEMVAHRAQDKGLEYVSLIAPEVPEIVRGDARRIRQVLIHLLGNAVKFTPAGEVVLQVSAERLDDGRKQVRFTVTDTGIGIPPERLENVFHAFSERVESRFSSHVPGVGLGLAICRRLVDLMDGKIGVISLSGKGSTFWFHIQLDSVASSDHRSGDSAEGLTKNLRNRKVLIVDDHPLNCSLLRQYCKHWDIACEDAGGAVPALQKLREAAWAKKPFALALIDLQMPGMTGEALVEQICDDPLLRGIPLVVMTDFGKRGEAAMQAQGKVAAFLPKPVRRAQLRCCLEVAMGCRTTDPSSIAPAVPRTTVTSERRRQFHVFLAEDNPMNRKVILKTLTHLGYQATGVENGKQLLERLRSEPCDLLLLDLQMPEMNGFEAAREIRRLETDRRLPIIALTAYAMDEDRENAFKVGMDEFLVKPIVTTVLAKVLERFLGTASPAQSVIGQIRTMASGETVSPESAEAVFHRRRLLERMLGDECRMREMTRGYINDFSARVAGIRGAWLEKRFEDAVRQVQVLRGGAFDLEAARLEERLRCMETVLRDGEVGRIEQQFELLNTDFAEFCAVVGECAPVSALANS